MVGLAGTLILAACTELTGPRSGDVPSTLAPASSLRNLSVASGARQWANRGTTVARPIVVRTSDEMYRPVAGVRVTFSVSLGGGTLADTTAITDANGLATVPRWTLGSGSEAQQLVVRAGSLVLPVDAFVLESGTTTPNQLTFVRDAALFTWYRDSTAPTRLLDVGPMLVGAVLSRDGETAVITEYRDNAESVCVIGVRSASRRCITPDGYGNLNGLALSPDGSQLLFSGMPFVRCGDSRCFANRSDLLRLDVRTMALTSVRQSDRQGLYVGGGSWAPDGRSIAYATGGTVFLANADGSDARSVPLDVDVTLFIAAARFSPDGSKLALLLLDQNACPFDCETLVGVADATGGPVRLLRREPVSVSVSHLGWSPDGRQISYTTTDDSPVRSNAMALPASGGPPALLLRGAELLDWR